MKQPKRLDFKNDRNGQALFEKAQKKYITFLKSENKQLRLYGVSQQREQLIAFLEMNNWFSLEDRKNAEGVVDCYLKAINCG